MDIKLDEEAIAMGAELPEKIIKYFSVALKEEREKQGLTIEQLASVVGVDTEDIELLESGEIEKMNKVSADILFYTAIKLKFDLAELFTDVKHKAMEELKAENN